MGAVAGALPGIISAAAGVGSLGTSLANMANGSSGALEIEFKNMSSQPVVVFDYNPNSCNVTKVPQPLASEESDIMLLTYPSAFGAGTSILICFMVGAIDVKLTYTYTDTGSPGRWKVKMHIDDETHEFDHKLQLMGATFQGDTNMPSFSIYTSPIESASGQMDVSIYDLSST